MHVHGDQLPDGTGLRQRRMRVQFLLVVGNDQRYNG
jgi:hypothetical protein